jgi:predicted Fe-Mo cluster-binding NifX family protein
MNICIPVAKDQGLDSMVYGHFGSAPQFLIVDTESLACRVIVNQDQHHAHGMCQPVAALGGNAVDGIVVGGIGRGALMGLNAAGLRVWKSTLATVRETVEAIKSGRLPVVTPDDTCGGHAAGGGCGHHDGHGPQSRGGC